MNQYEYISHRYKDAATAKEYILKDLGILAGKVVWSSTYSGHLDIPFVLNVDIIIAHDCYRVIANGPMAQMALDTIRKHG